MSAETSGGFDKVGKYVTGPVNAVKQLASPKSVKAAKLKLTVKVKKSKG